MFPFRRLRSIQAAGVLLGTQESRAMDYFHLLRLLYISDRNQLQAKGYPVVGGHIVATDHGPLCESVVLMAADWETILSSDGREVRMDDQLGDDELSPSQIQTLAGTANQYRKHTKRALFDVVRGFPEYVQNYTHGKRQTIPLADILRAVGHADDVVAAILKDAEQARVFDDLFREPA